MIRKVCVMLGACAFALCAIVMLWSAPLFAQTVITVDTFADAIDTNLDCSLREAVIAANTNITVDGCFAGSGHDVIALASGIYTLTLAGQTEQAALTGDLDITAPEVLTVQGAGMISTTINANALDRAFEILNPLSRVTLRDLTIQNGRVSSGEGSGAILNTGYLTLTNTLIQNNHVEGSTSNDVGGAICNGCGLGMGHLLIVNSTIRNNTADRAGGIFSNAVLTITESSIVSNSARAGGGLLNTSPDSHATLINTTISGNEASNNGGGISQSAGTLTVTNSTIANNTSSLGAGINYAGGATTLRNTIIAQNVGANCFSLGAGTLISDGNNLSNDASCNLTTTGDLGEVDARLLPLANYGGDTPTHKLSFTSNAIDGGTNLQCPAIDQRGIARPQNALCDIGAFEYDGGAIMLYLPLIPNDTL